jgi:hypothetical protein
MIVLALVGVSTISIALDQSEVCNFPPTCPPTGAHGKQHAVCSVCHLIGGTLSFDPSGPAYNPNFGAPSFDATTKTCSNIACHAIAPGTFSYYFPGNETDADGYPIPVLKTVHYGGGAPKPTPSWYATGMTCTACHGNPPYPSTVEGPDTWHSSFHANNQNVGAINPNACELCHNSTAVPYGTWVPVAFSSNTSPPLASADGNYHGYQINPAATGQHANGVATVQARFASQCFGCH